MYLLNGNRGWDDVTLIRNRLACYWCGAYGRAIGDYVVADSGREGEGAYCRLVGFAAFVEDYFAGCVWGVLCAWIGEEDLLPSGIYSLLILVIGYDTIPFGNENMEEYCGAA